MQEKSYTVIKAIDVFRKDFPIPTRTLIFRGPNGRHEEVSFPEDRTTLFFNGKLYDWYGNEVRVRSDIIEILQPFGYSGNPSDNPKEKFLVKTEDQLLAFANLHYDRHSSCRNSTLDFKQSLLYNVFYSAPELSREYWSFRKIVDVGAIFGHIDSEIAKCTAFIGVNGKTEDYAPPLKDYLAGKQPDSVYSLIGFSDGYTHSFWREHLIMESREKALSVKPSPYLNKSSVSFAKNKFLLGDIIISADGKKITTNSIIPDRSGNTRVSTDLEIIKHYAPNKHNLCWYYDPKP